jgi:hypothetical protein
MTGALKNLRSSLEHALELIDQSDLLPLSDRKNDKASSNTMTHLDFSQATSLLDKCNSVENQYQNEKPILRVIHHLACSGGTLICQCLATLPNTFLLSEMHPTTQLSSGSDKARYTPTDFILQAQFGKFPQLETLAKNIFVSSVEVAENHVRQNGSVLILRDHTHSDYSFGEDVPLYPVVKNILENKFHVKSLLTIRDPVDSYLSLIKNGWLHFNPATFDEYCRRFIVMLSHYSDAKICRYEDFVDEPISFMKSVCAFWELPFSDYFTSIFDLAKVSGGSGRKSENIQKMTRKPISNDVMEEIQSSENYKKICSLFDYGL